MENNQLQEVVIPLLSWFDDHARILPWRENPLPYYVWVSEIMLQQTRVEAVKPYFERWIRELPTVADVAQAPEDQLLLLWEGLGYYNRVRNIQKAARMILERYQGEIPASQKDLLSLPGIGDYTAGAIASIAFQQPVPCVDGNVLRVVARLTELKEDILKAAVKASVTKQVQAIMPQGRPGDFNQALMELGATVCLPNGQPKCEICPLRQLCSAYQNDSILQFPVKGEKKPRLVEEISVFLLIHEDTVAIRKRNSTGLLAGLWEFPNKKGTLSQNSARETLKQWGFETADIIKLKNGKHIFTHKEWHMTGYLAVIQEINISDTDFLWVKPEDVRKKYALPTAFHAFLRQLEDAIESQALTGVE